MTSTTLVLSVAIVLRLSTFGQDLSSIPLECKKQDLLANGKPFMTQAGNDLALGFSLLRSEFKAGDPIQLHIWVYKRGDVAAGVFTCMDLQAFKSGGFEVYR